ncbi:hypothetical protein CTAYLR_007735 [Chrysophaeum taylorii]|uniref:N-acetyltransferase domain-containing protein n=1 Tax=Chrysophaeum taylorii TaxID=2483200 RepID=A0AAD7XTD6_9STRA|nr:hypothetical protein CTAYLR_007735 [Chrysophaeum taylorii]
MSTTAYGGNPGDGQLGVVEAGIRTVHARLRDGTAVEVDTFSSFDIARGMELMNLVIREGKAWPFEEELDEKGYRAYFLTHAAFVVRRNGEKEVLGTFYVKPNFPGRCSHVCNGGFITAPEARGNGVGRLMGTCFLDFARKLGYRAAYFNLVFKSNEASVRLWESLGFSRVAEIPKCARLLDIGDDTAYGYYYDLES